MSLYTLSEMINYHITLHSQEQIAQLMSELKTERERDFLTQVYSVIASTNISQELSLLAK